MIAQGKSSVSLEEILSRLSEGDILAYYLGISEVPCVTNSPLRKDNRPSFGLYSLDGKKIYYMDFSTKDRGGLFDLLGKLWNCDYSKVLERIDKEIPKNISGTNIRKYTPCSIRKASAYNKNTDLQCRVREWRTYDIKYWEEYGISIEWLKYAEIFPISHKIIIKDGKKYVFGADKYAYAYVERKDGKVTLKIYQPFNQFGYKWSNKNDGSVISLWTKVPQEGEKICICSSLKDALCLWANTGIPAISLQGEGYSMSQTAVKDLSNRFNNVYIMFDNDVPGTLDGQKLAKETGFINLVLPQFEGGKDVSDLYKVSGKEKFLDVIVPLFNPSKQEWENDLPFNIE